ncbi:MAG TPA: UDP-2,3-diacylglucosamine diphosphatase LpxI [Pirellulales bacterium]|nr:UDP-2,3-diacylglucosamine diphosphatase LpxI [Pirellulales bacterium]
MTTIRATTSAPAATRIGLLAGWGRYPFVVAESLRRQGAETYCMGVKGHADPALAAVCDEFEWMGLGRLNRAVRFFKRHGIRRAAMAGKIHKIRLFEPWFWIKHCPDWQTTRRFFKHFVLNRRDRRDDTLLLAVVEEFAVNGIELVPATDFAPEVLVKRGQLTRRGPTAAQSNDIEFGWRLAKELGRLDVGQSVAVMGGTALAVEAIEGTDQCIRRAGELCRSGGFTVVKVAKPQQDMRFDVPTIGLGTLETMVEAGATCLAVEDGRTIIVDREETIRFANEHKLAIVAVDPARAALETPPETPCESRER